MSDWYAFLSQLSAVLNGPLGTLSGETGIPVVSAFLLGLVGAVSPCQLSANLATIAYLSRQARNPESAAAGIGAYLGGKIMVYSALGLIVLFLGLAVVSPYSGPFFAAVRKAMGPSLVLAGILMLGVLRLPFSVGDGMGRRLTRKAGRNGVRGAFFLGMGFSIAFCPTLFVLFFVRLLPMSMQSPGGFTFPGFFALGTAMPLIVLGPLVSLGVLGGQGLAGKVHRVDRSLRMVAGAVFVLLGLNETFNYWLV